MPSRWPLLLQATALTALLLLAAPSAVAAAAGTVVVVKSSDAAPYALAADAVQAVLGADGSHDILIRSVGDTVPQADIVIALGSKATRASAEAGHPLVSGMAMSAQDVPPGASGVVLRYPAERQLRLIRRALPQATRVGVVYADAGALSVVKEARSVADKLGLELVEVKIDDAAGLTGALDRLANQVDVLWAVPDPTLYTPQTAKPILLFSFRNHIPFFGLSESWVKAGALLAPAYDYAAIGAQCARMASAVMDGTGGGPKIESPDGLPYMVNTRTAKQLKVEIPAKVLAEARDGG